MKGLFFKDIMNLKQQWMIYMILVVFWGVLSLFAANDSLMFSCMGIFLVLTPISAFAYDERTKWDAYAMTTPLSRRAIVLSKYLLGWVMLAFLFAVMMIAAVISRGHFVEKVSSLLTVLGVMLICLSVELPLQFRFGSEKGRMISMVCVMIPVIIVVAGGRISDYVPEMPAVNAFSIAAAVFVLGALTQLLSVWISVRIYHKKDF